VWDAGMVIRRGRDKTGVADEHTGDLVVAKIIDGRGGQHQLRPDSPQSFRNPASGRVVVENGEVPHLDTYVTRTDQRRGIGRFPPADSGDLVRAQLPGAAVPRCKSGDSNFVTTVCQ